MNGRKSSLGCLGVLSVFCLSVFTLIELGVLLFMNPTWLDQWAWWRGKRIEPELTLVSSRAAVESAARADSARLTFPLGDDEHLHGVTSVEVLEGERVSVPVRAGEAARLERPEGVLIEAPAGAIRENTQLSVTPVAKMPQHMAGAFVGPVYDIRIGSAEHYQYGQPVKVTLPFDRGRVMQGEEITLATYENGKWTEVPCTVDPETGRVTATVQHASYWSIIRKIVTTPLPRKVSWPILLWVASHPEQFRSVGSSVYRLGSEELETDNFKIHYYLEGTDKVRFDAQYHARGGRAARYGGPGRTTSTRMPIDPNRLPRVTDTTPFNPPPDNSTRSVGPTPTGVGTPTVTPPPATPAVSAMIPLYVQDIARYAEESRTGLEAWGMKIPKASLLSLRNLSIKYDIFVGTQADLGLTPPAGPVYLANDIDQDAVDSGVDALKSMRATITHELIHVAQGGHFWLAPAFWEQQESSDTPAENGRPAVPGRFMAMPYETFIESSAAYLADRYWQERGEPTEMVRDYYLDQSRGRMLSVAPDWQRGNVKYAHSRLYWWADQRYADAGKKIVLDVHFSRDPSLESIDAAVKKHLSDKFALDFPGLLREFAFEYYYKDLWSGEVFPAGHKGVDANRQLELQTMAGTNKMPREQVVAVDSQFSYLLRDNTSDPTDKTRVLNIWGLQAFESIQHLTCQPLYVAIDQLPKKRKARLVVDAKPASGSTINESVSVWWATDTLGKTLPASGAPSGLKRLDFTSGRGTEVIDLYKQPKLDRLTVLVFNHNLTKDVRGVDVQRYLLLAPSFVTYSRDGKPPTLQARRYTVTWQKAELADWPDVFGGYNVYRKRIGEPDTSYVLVKEGLPDNVYTDHVDDDTTNWVYTVRVRDQLGNLSEPADPDDPFIGTWEGEITLVDGDIATPLINLVKEAGAKMDAQEQASINKIEDAARRNAAQAEWNKVKTKAQDIWGLVEPLLYRVDVVLRIGVPVKFDIDALGGKYYLRLTHVWWKPTELGPEATVPLRRTDTYVAEFVDEADSEIMQELHKAGLPKLELTLVRVKPESTFNSIRTDSYKIPRALEGKFPGAELKWSFERVKGPEE